MNPLASSRFLSVLMDMLVLDVDMTTAVFCVLVCLSYTIWYPVYLLVIQARSWMHHRWPTLFKHTDGWGKRLHSRSECKCFYSAPLKRLFQSVPPRYSCCVLSTVVHPKPSWYSRSQRHQEMLTAHPPYTDMYAADGRGRGSNTKSPD